MRTAFVLSLAILCLVAPLTSGQEPQAGAVPEREVAIRYEQAVQAGNKAFRPQSAGMTAVLSAVAQAKDVDPTEAAKALADFEAALAGFKAAVADVPPPASQAGKAYSNAVNKYLALLSGLAKTEYPAIVETINDTTLNAPAKRTKAAPAIKKAGQFTLHATAIKRTRQTFIETYQLDAASLAAATPALPPGENVTPVPMPMPGPTQAPAPMPMPVPTPTATGGSAVAKLDQTIAEGQKDFEKGMESLQAKLALQLLKGDKLDGKVVEEAFGALAEGVQKFKTQVDAVEIPQDADSQAYAAAAKKLLATLEAADFAGIAKALNDRTVAPEVKQAQLLEKTAGLQAALQTEMAAFEKAKAAFKKAHGL